MVETDRRREDEWFLKNEQKLIEEARIAREKRERERASREKQEERERLKALHFMKCPKCGHDMKEESYGEIVYEKCGFCEGIFFDAGEIEQFYLLRQTADEQARRGFLRKLIGI